MKKRIKIMILTIRIIAIILGCFLLLTSVLDILGIIKYSEKTPSLSERFQDSLLPIVFGLLLIAPYKKIKKVKNNNIFSSMLVLLSGYFIWPYLKGTFGPDSIVVVIVTGNVIAYFLLEKISDTMTRRT
ncbi:MAG: hypothetical protein PHV17_05800 [Candidatus Omnitrophica bacterium]|nr:hypothetical protein [Candidatus Omnitrophota bacterium]